MTYAEKQNNIDLNVTQRATPETKSNAKQEIHLLRGKENNDNITNYSFSVVKGETINS